VKNKQFTNQTKNQRGVGLLEAMLAVLIFALCVLSMANLSGVSISASRTAEVHGTVDNLAHEMLEILKADRFRARSNEYDISFDEIAPPASDAAAVTALVTEWKSRVDAALPDGLGEISCDNVGCVVSLRWRESIINGNNTQTFNLRASL